MIAIGAETGQGTADDARAGDDAAAIRESLDRPEAFTLVFDRHFDPVSSFVRRRGGHDATEEIVAETFTLAFRARARYDLAYPSALPWLLGIASNLLRKHWRTEGSRLAAYSRLANEPGGAPELSSPASPELRERLERLPTGQREVLLLFALADLTYDEIARALGIRVGTVRSRLARARRAMGEGGRNGLFKTTQINGNTEEGSNA